MRKTTRAMSDAHEAFLAELFDGIQSPGSGNQWNRPADGRHRRHERSMSFGWDGKSTLGDSIGIKLADLHKITEQAFPERPMLPLRFYGDERLRTAEDWVCIKAQDLAELLDHDATCSNCSGARHDGVGCET